MVCISSFSASSCISCAGIDIAGAPDSFRKKFQAIADDKISNETSSFFCDPETISG